MNRMSMRHVYTVGSKYENRKFITEISHEIVTMYRNLKKTDNVWSMLVAHERHNQTTMKFYVNLIGPTS